MSASHAQWALTQRREELELVTIGLQTKTFGGLTGDVGVDTEGRSSI